MKMIPLHKNPQFLMGTLLFALISGAVYQPNTRYQDRGDRYEGIKSSPVSDRVEVISVLIDHQEPEVVQPAPKFKLRFYLKDSAPVFVTVRELDNHYNYWLDRIKPQSGWRPGFDNRFEWSTDEVVRFVKGLRLQDLGAVAQLDEDSRSSLDMRVAPVILFNSASPQTVSKYLFTFRISRNAEVTCSFSRDEDNSPILSTQSFDVKGRRPRTVAWNVSSLKEGKYKLSINVIYQNNGEDINQIIRFFHRSRIE